MKSGRVVVLLVVFLLFSINSKLSYAYTTGQDADLVLGHSNFTTSQGNDNADFDPGPNTLYHPDGLIIVNNKLIVADEMNNRVLIWNSIPTNNGQSADVVIGQSDMYHNDSANPPTAYSLDSPTDVASNGTNLIIADDGNRRILIYNQIPTTNGAAADEVIGQPDMSTVNDTYPLTQYILNDPRSLFYDSNTGKLYITINDDVRVLGYNSIPVNGTGADIVVGQTSFSSQNVGTAANEFNGPFRAKVLDNKFVVADSQNGRVSIFNTIPTSNNATADVVLGKTGFNINPTTEQGPTQQFLTEPYDTDWDGHNFFALDENDSRVLVWNSFPTTNGASASAVLGYNSFTDNSGPLDPPTAASLDNPFNITHYKNYLFVSDTFNHRILRFTDNTTYSDMTVTSASISGLLNSGILQTQSTTNSPSVYVTQDLNLQTTSGNTTNQVEIPQQTTITTTSGNNFDPSELQVSLPSTAQLTSLGTDIQGDMQWGIPDVGLQFSQPITLTIYVGTDLNGQTLNILRSVYGTSGWTTNGIVGPATCVVSNGNCQFQATKASYYAVIPYRARSNSSSSSSSDLNFPSNYKYSIEAGPNLQNNNMSIIYSENDSTPAEALISKNVSTNDIHMFINRINAQDLLVNNIKFPWEQGYNTAGPIYNIQLLSAFNGYPIPQLDFPATIIIPYDPTILYGVNPSNLKIAYYDSSMNKWKLLQQNTVYDNINHTLSNTTKQFSYFTVVYPRK